MLNEKHWMPLPLEAAQRAQHAGLPDNSAPELPAYLGSWEWWQPQPCETAEEWVARTTRQQGSLIQSAASWLRIGQAVRVHADPSAGVGEYGERVGTIARLCSSGFADFTIVRFEPIGRQKVARTRMLPLEVLDPQKSGS